MTTAAAKLQVLIENWERPNQLAMRRAFTSVTFLGVFSALNGWNYRDLCWALWSNFVVVSIGLLVFEIIVSLRKKTTLGPSVMKVLGIAAAALGLSVAASVLGALFSFFAAHEPAHILGVNGFVNRGPVEVLSYTLAHYWPILIYSAMEMFFSQRLVACGRSPLSLFPGRVGVMVSALLIGLIGSLGIYFVAGKVGAEVFLLVFWLAWVSFPWRYFSKDSIQELQSDRRPSFYLDLQAPFSRVDRPSPAMVAIVWTLAFYFGLFTMGILAAVFWVPQRNVASLGSMLVMCVIALLLACATVFLGIVAASLSYSKREIYFDGSQFKVSEKKWENFREGFKSILWTSSLLQYKEITEKEVHHSDSDGPSYTEYTLTLVHQSDGEKNVELYRAYDRAHLPAFREHYSMLFKVAARPRP